MKQAAVEIIVNLTQNGSIQQLVSPLPSQHPNPFDQCSPPSSFLCFPWNPFHIIKDTQMKWTLRKSGFQQGRGCGGGWMGGGELGMGYWFFKEHPSLLPLSLLSPPTGAHPEGKWSASGHNADQYHLRY